MNRRQFLAGTAAVASTTLAGCVILEDVGLIDETVIRETARQSEVFRADLDEGEDIEVEITNDRGLFTGVEVEDPDGEPVIEFAEVESEETFEFTTEKSGTYSFWVYPDREGSIHVTIA